MSWAKDHLSDVSDGTVFLADELTKARGRDGRVWKCTSGQLMVTIALKPSFKLISHDNFGVRLNQLNMSLSLGILAAIKEYGVSLKWPNDFIAQANHKKVGGMLMSVVWEDDDLKGVILGFAININNKFDEQDELFSIATSLSELAGHAIEIRQIYFNILKSLDDFYALWRDEKFDDIYKKWRKEQLYLGKVIEVHKKDGSLIKGLLKQVMPNGDIILREDGRGEEILSFHVVENLKIPN
jgi:biotin-[acetyl-CoA-carboxylase] ligase BirA-like protein